MPLSEAAEVNPFRDVPRDQPVPFIEMGAVDTDFPAVRSVAMRTFSGSGSRFGIGDTLLARITPCAENGKTALITDLPMPSTTGFGSTEFIVLGPRPGLTCPEFIYYLMRSSSIRSILISRMVGTSGRKRIPFTALDAVLVPVPPLREQQEIASVLSSVDDAIEATKAVIERLQSMKEALMAELFAYGIQGRTFDKLKKEDGVPEDWGITTLGNAGSWLSGGTPSKGRFELWTGSIPWVSPKDMKRLRIVDAIDHVADEAVGAGTQLAPKGSILMVVRGMILVHSFPVGMAMRPVAFNQDIKVLCPGASFVPDFLLYLLIASKDEILRRVDVANHGTRRLASERLFELSIPVPSRDEQEQICNLIRSIEERIDAEIGFRDQLRMVKSAILPALLTGELRVTPDEAPA